MRISPGGEINGDQELNVSDVLYLIKLMRLPRRLTPAILCILALATPAVQAQIPTLERDALIALYDATNGANWTANTGWKGAVGTECSWYRVTCDAGETTVTELALYSNQLTGSIPAELGNLASLQYLYLFGNQLTGSIPGELGNLASLQTLYLFGNQLTGSIPGELGTLSLSYLNLRYNALFAADPAAESWADTYDREWETTQTVAPEDLAGTQLGGTVTITWTPILYTGNGGGYEIQMATSQAGPFSLAATVSGKASSSGTVEGVDAAVHYFRVRSFTEPHSYNQNRVESTFTEAIPVAAAIPPSISAVTPASGPTGGGTLVTITGDGFVDGASVQLGGAAASEVTFVDASSLQARTPAGPLGPADVTVTNPDTLSATLEDGFTFMLNGDANGDDAVNVSDIFYLINHLFAGGPPPIGPADINGDQELNVSDVLYLINHLFAGGPAPAGKLGSEPEF